MHSQNSLVETGFAEMLDVTSRLRKAQEEDAGLASKAAQQKAILQQAEARADDARRRLKLLRQGATSATTASAVLEQLQREVGNLFQTSNVYVEGRGRRLDVRNTLLAFNLADRRIGG